jgi:hypothetical protein
MKFELPPRLPDEVTAQRRRREKRQSVGPMANTPELERDPNRSVSTGNHADSRPMPASPLVIPPQAGDHPPPPPPNIEAGQTNQSRTDHSDNGNSDQASATRRRSRHHGAIMAGAGLFIIAVPYSLYWLVVHNSTSRFQSPNSVQDNSRQAPSGNSSEVAPNTAASPKPDANVQLGAQPAEPALSPNSQQGSAPTAIPSPYPTPSTSGVTSPAPAPKVAPTTTPPPTPVVRHGAMMYEVVKCDYLNVRSGAGSTYPVVGRLALGTSDISSVGAAVKNGSTTWLPISVGGLSGWVNSDFLKPSRGKGTSPSSARGKE